MIIVYFLLLVPVDMELITSEVAMSIIIGSLSIISFKSAYMAYKEKNKKKIISNIVGALFLIGLACTCFII